MSEHVYIRDMGGMTGSFSDPRVFLVRPDELEVGSLQLRTPERCGMWQAEDGPAYVIVGPYVVEDSLERVSSRYGVPLQDLVKFRENQKAA